MCVLSNPPSADARSRKVKQAYLKQNDGRQSLGNYNHVSKLVTETQWTPRYLSVQKLCSVKVFLWPHNTSNNLLVFKVADQHRSRRFMVSARAIYKFFGGSLSFKSERYQPGWIDSKHMHSKSWIRYLPKNESTQYSRPSIENESTGDRRMFLEDCPKGC